jgi:hypothetical protein
MAKQSKTRFIKLKSELMGNAAGKVLDVPELEGNR